MAITLFPVRNDDITDEEDELVVSEVHRKVGAPFADDDRRIGTGRDALEIGDLVADLAGDSGLCLLIHYVQGFLQVPEAGGAESFHGSVLDIHRAHQLREGQLTQILLNLSSLRSEDRIPRRIN